MPTPALTTLLIQETKDTIYAFALRVATAIGLPVTSWQAGDPTRSLYNLEAETLAKLEEGAVGYISSGFLGYAHGAWLKVCALQGFGVEVPDATFASTDVVLTNGGAGVYDFDPLDLTLQNTASGKTYRNTTGGHLGAFGTLTITVEAEEAGSDSSAGAGEIDDLVTVIEGVTCSNALAAVGIDEQDESVTIQQCNDMTGPLSPNGPKEAFSFVARSPKYGGTVAVTRDRVYSSSDTGDVTQYLAGPSGGVSEPVRAQVEAAVVKWSTGLCITPTVLAATNVAIDVTYSVLVYKSVNQTEAEVKAAILTALEDMIAARDIGGDIVPPATDGIVAASLIVSTIRSAFPQIFRVLVTAPSADVSVTNAQVPTLGTVTGTVTFVVDP